MGNFLTSTGLAASLQAHDWASFARGYNGPNCREFFFRNRFLFAQPVFLPSPVYTAPPYYQGAEPVALRTTISSMSGSGWHYFGEPTSRSPKPASSIAPL